MALFLVACSSKSTPQNSGNNNTNTKQLPGKSSNIEKYIEGFGFIDGVAWVSPRLNHEDTYCH